MRAYLIKNKHGELILWTINYQRRKAIEVFTKMKSQIWQELVKEGYETQKVLVLEVSSIIKALEMEREITGHLMMDNPHPQIVTEWMGAMDYTNSLLSIE